MSTPNPPSNYRVVNQSGIKKLYFDVDTSTTVIQSRVYLIKDTGNILLGTTPDDFIIVSTSLVGPEDLKGQSEGVGGGWGVLNDPAVSVDFGS